MTIKVGLIEDDNNFRNALTKYLNNQGDLIVIGYSSEKEGALSSDLFNKVDVILVDCHLSEGLYDGVEVVKALRERPEITAKIIMLTSLNDDALIKTAFMLGANNYVLKEDYQQIPEIIRTTILNKTPIDILAEDYRRLKIEDQLKVLTPSEREIYDLMDAGYSRSKLPEKLFKSENTIKSLIKKMLKKLQVNNSKEAFEKVKWGGSYDDIHPK